jgi:hypothetical protein
MGIKPAGGAWPAPGSVTVLPPPSPPPHAAIETVKAMVQTGLQNLPATGIECNMIIPPWKVNQSKQFPDAPLLVSTQSLVVSLAYLLSKSKLADEVFAPSHIVEPKSELARSAAELLSKRDGAQSMSLYTSMSCRWHASSYV